MIREFYDVSCYVFNAEIIFLAQKEMGFKYQNFQKKEIGGGQFWLPRQAHRGYRSSEVPLSGYGSCIFWPQFMLIALRSFTHGNRANKSIFNFW